MRDWKKSLKRCLKDGNAMQLQCQRQNRHRRIEYEIWGQGINKADPRSTPTANLSHNHREFESGRCLRSLIVLRWSLKKSNRGEWLDKIHMKPMEGRPFGQNEHQQRATVVRHGPRIGLIAETYSKHVPAHVLVGISSTLTNTRRCRGEREENKICRRVLKVGEGSIRF